jgi:hypothetical protein
MSTRSREAIAIEGRLTAYQTPARREAIATLPSDARSGFTLLDGAVPVSAGETALVLSTRELDALAPFEPTSTRMRNFYAWTKRDCATSRALHAARTKTGGFYVWFCSTDEALAFLRLIEAKAWKQLLQAMTDADKTGVHEAAFWLQRASQNPVAWLLAAEALANAGLDRYAETLSSLARAQAPEACAVIDMLMIHRAEEAEVDPRYASAPADREADMRRAFARREAWRKLHCEPACDGVWGTGCKGCHEAIPEDFEG